jgi:hypothetical protein
MYQMDQGEKQGFLVRKRELLRATRMAWLAKNKASVIGVRIPPALY